MADREWGRGWERLPPHLSSLFFFSYTRLKSVVASYAETEFRSFFLLLKIVARTYILQAVVLFSFKVGGMGLGEVLYCTASRLFMHISQM